MSGHIATYDARKVTTVIGGVILTGFPDGSFVKCSKDNDNFEASSGAQGDVAIAINGDSLGTIEVTLSQTSPSVSYLDKLANNREMVSAWVNSVNEVKEVKGGSRAMVTKPADAEFGKSISNRVYTIKVFDYQTK
ncbi:phage structural protein [Lysinibacillus sp. 54212]|uniref:phage structural protein n=1 Tax=Lysinibacillus sp. 54212 TaxID=3119829 RepID=UPI002FC8EA95